MKQVYLIYRADLNENGERKDNYVARVYTNKTKAIKFKNWMNQYRDSEDYIYYVVPMPIDNFTPID